VVRCVGQKRVIAASSLIARWDNPFPRTGCTLDVQG
jgi:hypothetical protein